MKGKRAPIKLAKPGNAVFKATRPRAGSKREIVANAPTSASIRNTDAGDTLKARQH